MSARTVNEVAIGRCWRCNGPVFEQSGCRRCYRGFWSRVHEWASALRCAARDAAYSFRHDYDLAMAWGEVADWWSGHVFGRQRCYHGCRIVFLFGRAFGEHTPECLADDDLPF